MKAYFTESYSVWVVLPSVDYLVSSGELILVSRGFNVSVHPMSLLSVRVLLILCELKSYYFNLCCGCEEFCSLYVW